MWGAAVGMGCGVAKRAYICMYSARIPPPTAPPFSKRGVW